MKTRSSRIPSDMRLDRHYRAEYYSSLTVSMLYIDSTLHSLALRDRGLCEVLTATKLLQYARALILTLEFFKGALDVFALFTGMIIIIYNFNFLIIQIYNLLKVSHRGAATA